MMYLDRTNCKSMKDKGVWSEVQKVGALSRKATKIAEQNGLAVLASSHGDFRIIFSCGFGAYRCFFKTLAEVNEFFLNLDSYKNERLFS